MREKRWLINNFILGPHIQSSQTSIWTFLPLWFHDWNSRVWLRGQRQAWGQVTACRNRQLWIRRHSPERPQSLIFRWSSLFGANYFLTVLLVKLGAEKPRGWRATSREGSMWRDRQLRWTLSSCSPLPLVSCACPQCLRCLPACRIHAGGSNPGPHPLPVLT